MKLSRWMLIILGLAALILAHCVALLFRVNPAVSLWFPPSGVAVTLALWFGWTGVVLTWIASFLMSHLWGNDGWLRFASLTDATEPSVALLLFRYYWRSKLDFKRLRDAVTFIISAPVLGCGTSALLGCLVLSTAGKMPWQNFNQNILRWWLGNAVGVMAVAPLLLLLLTPVLNQWRLLLPTIEQEHQSSIQITAPDNHSKVVKFLQVITDSWIEISGILISSIFIAVATVYKADTSSILFQNYSFLNFIPIIWAATRFKIIGGTITASFCVLATIIAYLITFPNSTISLGLPISSEVLQVHKLSLFVQCSVSLLIGSAITEQAAVQTMLAVERVRAAEYQALAQLSQQLEQANIQLQQSNQEKDELLQREQTARSEAESANRAKDEFLAVLSHELRTPLNPILGWTHILRTRQQDEVISSRALETIERNVKHLTRLIDDLLDVSRILSGKFTLKSAVVNLESTIQAAIETVDLAANAKSIDLEFTKQTTQFLVLGDTNRLQQVVSNLLSNAIKFTPNGGNVKISLLSIISNDSITSDYAQITITDTGQGINPEFLPYVFERFRQADSSITRIFGGLGLGLAIVRQIVEMHKGKVAVASEGENKGATFTIQLPLIKTSPT